jgi:hypothetical protein
MTNPEEPELPEQPDQPEQPELNRLERLLLSRYTTPEPPPELQARVLAELFTPRELEIEQFGAWRSNAGRSEPDQSEGKRAMRRAARHKAR